MQYAGAAAAEAAADAEACAAAAVDSLGLVARSADRQADRHPSTSRGL